MKTPIQRYLAPAIFVCLSLFSACGSGSLDPGVGAPLHLVSIAVTPSDADLLLGTLQQYTATGTYSDKSTKDLTASVTWATSSINVASISGGGMAAASALGSVTVSATSDSVVGSTTANVQSAVLISITIRPANKKIAKFTTQQFAAIGTYSDGSTHNISGKVSWASSNTVAAGIVSSGLVTALTPGTTTITATLGSISASTTLEVTNATIVSISVSPSGRTIAQATRLTFTATGHFSDGSSQVITIDCTWTSDDPAVATVGARGTATAVGAGTANISATFYGVSGSAPLYVSSVTITSISVTPASAVLAPATFVNCVATATFSDGTTQTITSVVTWTSSASEVASVGGGGRVTAIAGGTAIITAEFGSVNASSTITVDSSPLTSLQVSPSTASVAVQSQVTFKAVGTFADGNNQDLTNFALWTSSLPSVATISAGRATGVSPGTTTIVALFGGQVGAAGLTVTSATSATTSVANARTAH